MSKNKCESFEHIKTKSLKSEKIKAKSINSNKICVKDTLTSDVIKTNSMFINGVDLNCLFNTNDIPIVSNFLTPYDCMDCDGNPIKPDKINQDVWDFLECNRKAYQTQIENENLAGREEIRCIKQAYGCGADCPGDCLPPPTCKPIFLGGIVDKILTVESLEPNTGDLLRGSNIFSFDQTGDQVLSGSYIIKQNSGVTGGVGEYEVNLSQNVSSGTKMEATYCPTVDPGSTGPCPLIPSECIADWETCDLFVKNNLFKTITVPFTSLSEKCPEFIDNFLTAMNYTLNINNVSCTLGTRNATVLVHYAYLEENVVPNPPFVDPCEQCPGTTPSVPIICIPEEGGVGCNNLSPKIICGIVDIQVKQIYYTININLGENFANNVPIPSFITNNMNKATQPIDYNDIKGAFQLAIFLEEGIEVSNNTSTRNCDAACAVRHAMEAAAVFKRCSIM